MERVVLKATRRNVTGKQVKGLRRQGRLPGVLYGHGFEPVAISLDAHESSLILPGLSSSAIVTVDLEGEQHAALVRERQKDYIRNAFIHVDFQVVSLTEKLRTMVHIEVHGLSPAVKDFNAVLVNNLTQVEVQALPQDLPERLIVDVANLATIGDAFHVRDLTIPNGVEVLTDPEEIIVVATGAAPEEVEEGAAAEAAEPEIIERGKKEEEEDEKK
jgi:large subunit ribosomal protein L25